MRVQKLKVNNILTEVLNEVNAATDKFPLWPTDPIHAAGVLNEEVGELNKEVLQLVYEPHKTTKEKAREEAVQAAAMSIRFLLSFDRYEFRPSSQHSQD